MKAVDLIAFDADDTLWHNETIFIAAQSKFVQLVANYHREEWIGRRLYETEARNLRHFGYGVKGFTLSMIETAIELSEGRITAAEIQQVIEFGKEMLKSPIELLDGVEESIRELKETYPLMVITKGDLFDQEAKLARSGLGEHFSKIEIVAEKDRSTYERIIKDCGVDPRRFLMVGNSLKSDISPVAAIGAHAVHIPYEKTWAHETVAGIDLPDGSYIELEHIRLLPALLAQMRSVGSKGSEGS